MRTHFSQIIRVAVILSALVFVLNMATLAQSASEELELRDLRFQSLTTIGLTITHGNYAYCATGYGLLILDIEEVSNPKVNSALYIPALVGPHDIETNGQHLFIIGSDDVFVINISNPAVPFLESTFNPHGYIGFAKGSILGNFLLVYGSDDIEKCFFVIDISNPDSLFIETKYVVESTIRDLIVSDTLAFVTEKSKLEVFNISDPTAPYPVGECLDLQHVTTYSKHIFAIKDTTIYVVYNDTLKILNANSPENPCPIAIIDIFDGVINIIINGSMLFVYELENHTTHVYNIEDPLNSQFVCKLEGLYISLFHNENPISIGGTFKILDISDIENPEIIGSYQTTYTMQDIKVSGDFAYIAGDHFLSFDVSYPRYPYPKLIGGLYLDGAAVIEIVDPYAYTIDNNGTLKIVDINDPAALELAGTLENIGTYCTDIGIYGDHAYITANLDGIQIINISDPSAPFIEGNYDLQHSQAIDISGHYAYVDNLYILDLSAPLNPILSGNCYVQFNVMDIEVIGDYAYAAIANVEPYNGYMGIINVADPTAPFVETYIETSTEGKNIAAADGFAYYMDFDGIHAFDVSNPAEPELFGQKSAVYNVAIDAKDSYLFALSSWGFGMSDVNRPNDFSCADANNDGTTNIGDAVFLINYIFKGGDTPSNCDANCDEGCNVGDAVFLINYVFKNGQVPCEYCN
ncbi:MAG: dockerin type I domain-containing protein [candidate division Zixibacteria bacterium]